MNVGVEVGDEVGVVALVVSNVHRDVVGDEVGVVAVEAVEAVE